MSRAVPVSDEVEDTVDYQVPRVYTDLDNLLTDLDSFYDVIAGFESKDYNEEHYDELINPDEFETEARTLEGDVLVVFSEEVLSSDSMSPEETEQLLEERGYNFIAPSHAFGNEFYPPQNYAEDDVTGHWLPRFEGKAIYITQNSP